MIESITMQTSLRTGSVTVAQGTAVATTQTLRTIAAVKQDLAQGIPDGPRKTLKPSKWGTNSAHQAGTYGSEHSSHEVAQKQRGERERGRGKRHDATASTMWKKKLRTRNLWWSVGQDQNWKFGILKTFW